MTTRSLVSVVDDDESVRESLPDMLRQFGFAAAAFSSAEEFLASDVIGRTNCLILDVKMPGMSGPGPAARTGDTRARDTDRLHHRERGQDDSNPLAVRWGRRVPLQAFQRSGSPGRTAIRPSDEVAMSATRGSLTAPATYTGRSANGRTGIEVVNMPDLTSIVFVVDDDISVRESLELLIRSAGWRAETFESGQDFLSRPRVSVPCCLLLDVTLPGLNGLELQQQLAERTDMPIIFITGHGDIPMTVRAMKAGAAEFLTKPLKDDVLVDAIRGALERSRAALRVDAELQTLRTCYDSLTPREREVMARVVGRHAQQAGRRRSRYQRDHGEGTPRTGDAQDEGRVPA